MKLDSDALVVTILLFLCFVAGFVIRGIAAQHELEMLEKEFKVEAVENGFAEWVTDTQGNTEWRWINVGENNP